MYILFRPLYWPSSVDAQGRGTLVPYTGYDRPYDTNLKLIRTFDPPLRDEWGPRFDPRNPARPRAHRPKASYLVLNTWEMQDRYGAGQHDDRRKY